MADDTVVAPRQGSNEINQQNSSLGGFGFGSLSPFISMEGGVGAPHIAQDILGYTDDPFGAVFAAGDIQQQQQMLAMPTDLTPISGSAEPNMRGGTSPLFSLAGGDPAAAGWTQLGGGWTKNGTQIQEYGGGNRWQVNHSISPFMRALMSPGQDPNRYYWFSGPGAGLAQIDTGSYGYKHGRPAGAQYAPDASNVAGGYYNRPMPESYPRGSFTMGGAYYYPGQTNQLFGGMAMPGDST